MGYFVIKAGTFAGMCLLRYEIWPMKYGGLWELSDWKKEGLKELSDWKKEGLKELSDCKNGFLRS